MCLLLSGRPHTPPVRTLAASAAVAAVLGGGLAACGGSDRADAGEVAAADLHEVQDDLAVLEDRVGRLEGREPSSQEMSNTEKADLLDREVTVNGEVSEVITASAMGIVVRVDGGSVPSVAVLADAPPKELDQGDVVQISGTAHRVDRDSFEDDFGIAASDLFEDPHTFFRYAEGQPAISVTRIEIVQEPAGG